MKKIILCCAVLTALVSCKKDDKKSSSTTPPTTTSPVANNTFTIYKPDGTELKASFTSYNIGVQTDADGSSYSYIGYFSVGSNSTYDRLAINFKSLPNDGDYKLQNPKNYHNSNLGTGYSGVNITYDNINYMVNTDYDATVKVSTEGGKKKVTLTKAMLSSGSVVMPGGTKLPDSCLISAVILE